MVQQDDQDPRLERQMKYAKDLNDAINVNRLVKQWHTYAHREISLATEEALQYTPDNNLSELRPDVPIPKTNDHN